MTFYFYDLETSGFGCRDDRIMQFGGQRTDMELKPIGPPDNILIKMTPDVLPEPGAVLVHGITPQKTLAEGLTEAEFARYLTSQVSGKDTIMVGYNNVRFDNDFIRFTLWRNFHDAYEWAWKGNCSTWDLLDVVRMTRALRPEGIEWPFASDGRPTNSLAYITAVNKLEHPDAHDAASDVKASIALARLLKAGQPGIFDFLLNLRSKQNIAPLVTKSDPLVYTSGRYPSSFLKTTVAVMAAQKPDKSGALMYDLRLDPNEFKGLSVDELVRRWKDRAQNAPYFPVKELKYNRCPAVAPMSYLDDKAAGRLQIHPAIIDNHLAKLRHATGFGDKLLEALERLWPPRPSTSLRAGQLELMVDDQKVDGLLYDSFVKEEDRVKMSALRAAKIDELAKISLDFADGRLKALLPLYKARNFPQILTEPERQAWQKFRRQKLLNGKSSLVDKYYFQIDELGKTPGLNNHQHQLLAELKDYGRSLTAAI